MSDTNKAAKLPLEESALLQFSHQSNDAFLFCNEKGIVVHANPSFYKSTGFPEQDIIGMSNASLIQMLTVDEEAARRWMSPLTETKDAILDTWLKRKSGERFQAEMRFNAFHNEAGDVLASVFSFREFSANQVSEEELKYNLRQQELLSEIALDLNNYEEFEKSIQLVLNALLKHTQVSRIYIFENVDNGLACSNTFEVCNEGIEPQISNLAYLPYEVVPYWVKTMAEVGMIFSEDISELPLDVREILEPQEIKSILVFPLKVNGDFFGFIGFDECVVYKKWKRSDIELLRGISGIIGNAYEREISRNNLLNKNEELNKINAELDNFVYSVSHDLRSPLLSVKGILDLVFKTTQLDEKTFTLLKSAEISVDRLDTTIQEILDYSKNSRLGLTLERFDLAQLLEEIYTDLKFSSHRGIDFRLHVEEPCRDITADRSRLNTILKNVIGNSVKYQQPSAANPYVEVNAAMNNGQLTITVSDNGEGISSEHLPRVFDMFYRASKSSSGSGLGLYICKEIVQKINGSIELTSQQGIGTTVTITLPVI